ncbi:MAG: FISUMP domain-containing protein [Bacteroidota bacterium]
MKYLPLILVGALMLLSTCKEAGGEPGITFGSFVDPRDNNTYETVSINGTVWMAQNLRYKATSYNSFGAPIYSYQQSLNYCPEGWTVPSLDDWKNLFGHFGGYKDENGNNQGDPTKGFFGVARGSKPFMGADQFYQTSTPTWGTNPESGSYRIYLNDGTVTAEIRKGGAIVKYVCRCINKPKPQADDYLRFRIGDELHEYNFYRIDFEPVTVRGQLLLLIHNNLNRGGVLDRCLFGVKLPSANIATENPQEGVEATLNHQLQSTTLPDVPINLTVTFYDGKIIEGTFTGQTPDLQHTEGEFHFKVNAN